MSSYDHICLIDGYIDAVADIVCSESLYNLKGIGIFLEQTPPKENQTTSAAIRQENDHLGLASWSLTPLYVEGKKRLLKDADDYRAASAMLLAAPDYFTAWNVRKRRLQPNGVAGELKFSELVILRSPKSAESWSHRAWLLRTMKVSAEQIQRELELAWTAAYRAQNNYYVGVHRLRVTRQATDGVLQAELQRSAKWLRTNVSDSSGWWYHRHLLEILVEAGSASLETELATHSDWVDAYDNLQCVQTYRLWLVKRRACR